MGILMGKAKDIMYNHPSYKAWMEKERKAIEKEMKELTKKKDKR